MMPDTEVVLFALAWILVIAVGSYNFSSENKLDDSSLMLGGQMYEEQEGQQQRISVNRTISNSSNFLRGDNTILFRTNVAIKEKVEVLVSHRNTTNSTANNDETDTLLDDGQISDKVNEATLQSRPHLFWRSCPFIRFSYHCEGEQYDNYTAQYSDALDSWLQNHTAQFDKDLLIVGNSHTGQLAEELFCLLYDDIIDFQATSLETACLQPFPKDESCDGHGEANMCGMYLAVATIQNKNSSIQPFRIFIANNHPYLFTGKKGIETLLTKMQVNVSQLGTVVLGDWNNQKWATEFLSTNFSHYPTPAFGKECGGSLEKDFDPVKPDVVGVLAEQGFHGKILRYMRASRFPSHKNYTSYGLPNNALPFPAKNQPKRGCMVDDCDSKYNWVKHVCVPGYSVFPALQALYSLLL